MGQSVVQSGEANEGPPVCGGIAQAIGSAAIGGATFIAALVLMKLVNATGTLRVSEQGELDGLDLHEHGAGAYHFEFGGSSLTMSGSVSGDRAPEPVGAGSKETVLP